MAEGNYSNPYAITNYEITDKNESYNPAVYSLYTIGNTVILNISSWWVVSCDSNWLQMGKIPSALISRLSNQIRVASILYQSNNGNIIDIAQINIDPSTRKIRMRSQNSHASASYEYGVSAVISW